MRSENRMMAKKRFVENVGDQQLGIRMRRRAVKPTECKDLILLLERFGLASG